MDNIFIKNGSEYIDALVKEAVENGSRTATVTGKLEIERAVRIPSDFTLILENCHLKMASGVFDNMFVNEHHGTESGKTLSGRDKNISIIGRGEAILDGGEYNGLSEKTQNKNGLPPIWKNNLLLFTNVEGFKISDISVRNQRWWALNFIYCAHGYIGNIDFCACDVGIDADGNEYHGLRRGFYSEILVKNADGIDLRQGCHDILIENVTGFTEDDTVALTALPGRLEATFGVPELDHAICNVTVKNICSATYCTNVRLLNQGGGAIHDVLIDGIYDKSESSPHVDRGLHAVSVGDDYLYGSRHSTADETYNIEIKNLYSRGEVAALVLYGATKSLKFSGIEAADGTTTIKDERCEKR